MIKLTILGFLSVRPMSGYELDKTISSSLNFFWPINQSQIYMELNRLESEEKIIANLVIQENKPNKKIYQLTENGKDELAHLLNPKTSRNNFKIKKIPFLVWTFFGFLNSKEKSIEYLENFKKFIDNEIEAIEFQKAHVEKLDGLELQKIYWISASEFGISHYRKMHEWANKLILDIEKYYSKEA